MAPTQGFEPRSILVNGQVRSPRVLDRNESKKSAGLWCLSGFSVLAVTLQRHVAPLPGIEPGLLV